MTEAGPSVARLSPSEPELAKPDVALVKVAPPGHGEHVNPEHNDPNLEDTELVNIQSRPTEEDLAREHGQRLRRLKTPRFASSNPINKFWRRQVSVAVPHEDCRDHLALERTFLGYLRTSTAICMSGVTIAQLFRLDNRPTDHDDISFFEVGTPLAALMVCVSIAVTLLGAYRFWRLQNALVRSKARAAGWELHAMTIGVGGLMVILFTIVVRVNFRATVPDDD